MSDWPQATSVASALRAPGRITWIRRSTLTVERSFDCIDGRARGAIVGAPGGDVGELVLLLGALEQVSARPLSTDAVRRLFEHHVAARQRFYMHTDNAAISRLARAVTEEPTDMTAPTEWFARLRQPTPALRDALHHLVARPELTGCGHLRRMLEVAAQYGVRARLVAEIVRAFYDALWDGDCRFELEMLEGSHRAKAIVVIDRAREADEARNADEDPWLPAIQPNPGGELSFFIVHPVARRAVATHAAAHLLEAPDAARITTDVERLLDCVDRLGARQLEATIACLAPTHPVFRMSVGIDGAQSWRLCDDQGTCIDTQADRATRCRPSIPTSRAPREGLAVV